MSGPEEVRGGGGGEGVGQESNSLWGGGCAGEGRGSVGGGMMAGQFSCRSRRTKSQKWSQQGKRWEGIKAWEEVTIWAVLLNVLLLFRAITAHWENTHTQTEPDVHSHCLKAPPLQLHILYITKVIIWKMLRNSIKLMGSPPLRMWLCLMSCIFNITKKHLLWPL